MNILAFHQNIMNKNIKLIKQREIMANFKKKKWRKKIFNQRTTYFKDNDNDNFLKENIFSRSRKRHGQKVM